MSDKQYPSCEGLKPCPFCGSEAEMFDAGPHTFWVECSGCKSEGRAYESKDGAIAAWNRRSPDLEGPLGGKGEGDSSGVEARAHVADATETEAQHSAGETISERFARVGQGKDYAAALAFLRTPARYIDLGQACEGNGLAGFGDDGQMWFQPPGDLIAERSYKEGWNDREDDLILGVRRVAHFPAERGADGGGDGVPVHERSAPDAPISLPPPESGGAEDRLRSLLQQDEEFSPSQPSVDVGPLPHAITDAEPSAS